MRLVAGMGTVALGAVVAFSSGASSAPREKLVFHAPLAKAQFHGVDSSPDGPWGDYVVTELVFFKNGRKAGHLEANCFTTATSPIRQLCHGVARIKGRGLLSVADIDGQAGQPGTSPITGGSGDFRDATGIFKLEFAKRAATLTFNID